MARLLLACTAAGALFGAVALACGSNELTSNPATDAGTTPDKDSGSAEPGSAPVFYSVGGSVVGLAGTGLVLHNDTGDDLPIGANGSFVFPTKVSKGTSFSVTIKSQPLTPPQTCTVAGGTGTVASGDITTVIVNCSANATVGGTVSGLVGTGLVLQNNDGDDLAVGANGTFAFPLTLAPSTNYAVTVKTQPNGPSQTCTVANGAGAVAGNVTNVAITCTTNRYTVGGNVIGLTGSGLVLQNNWGEELAVTGNGPFTFPTSLEDGTAFGVRVMTQPKGQLCKVSGTFGNLAGANETFLFVTCQNAFTVGGTVTGLDGTGLVLSLYAGSAGGELLPIKSNGAFAFAPLLDGASYSVSVYANPSVKSQYCTVTHVSGLILGANVTNIAVNCTTSMFETRGWIHRLTSSGLVLTNNGEDISPPSGATSFAFPTKRESESPYNVVIAQQPKNDTCVVLRGSGTLPGGPEISCAPLNCAFVNGTWWCVDPQKGRGCNAFCSSMPGFGNPHISNSAWLAAQDSAYECAQIGLALNIGKISTGYITDACASTDGFGTFTCSMSAGCPAKHREETFPSSFAVCPCD